MNFIRILLYVFLFFAAKTVIEKYFGRKKAIKKKGSKKKFFDGKTFEADYRVVDK